MRGQDQTQEILFSTVSLEERIPQDHPVRAIRKIVEEVLQKLSGHFEGIYSATGRPSIAPERLLRALLLQMLCSVRSERQLVQRLNFDLLFRWFVGLTVDEPVWDASTYSKNRERMLEGETAREFFRAVLEQARSRQLLSEEHFSVDGTLIEAWASEKSYQKKPNPPSRGSGSRGELRMRDTHESQTDPDAQLYRKSHNGAMKLHHMAHALTENRHGLVVETALSECSPAQERHQAVEMVKAYRQRQPQPGPRLQVVGGDKAYNEKSFVEAMEALQIAAHVPAYTGTKRKNWIDPTVQSSEAYKVSQRKRKYIERWFGWLKTVAGLRKTRHRGRPRVHWMYTFAAAAYNLVKIIRLERFATSS
jgi:transposase